MNSRYEIIREPETGQFTKPDMRAAVSAAEPVTGQAYDTRILIIAYYFQLSNIPRAGRGKKYEKRPPRRPGKGTAADVPPLFGRQFCSLPGASAVQDLIQEPVELRSLGGLERHAAGYLFRDTDRTLPEG